TPPRPSSSPHHTDQPLHSLPTRRSSDLQAPGHSATPGWVLSVDPQGQVLMTPQVRTELQEDQTVQLWTKPSATEPLRSHLRSHRSEEHTSELQSRFDIVCRLLLENKTTT